MLLSSHAHYGYFATNDSDPAASAGTTVTSGTANTYGSWTQLHAGFTYAVDILEVNITNTGANNTVKNAYIDIGIGATNTTVAPLVEKIGGVGTAPGFGACFEVPIRIPPDTPVWARHQNVTASTAAGVQITAIGGNQNPGSMPMITQVVPLGATTASTAGTTLTVGASGAEGAWTQIVASTTEDYAGFLIGFFNTGVAHTAGVVYSFDVGVGASGQELVVGHNLTRSTPVTASEQFISVARPTFVGIPSGSRLSVRGSCTGAVITVSSVILYGFKH